MTRTALPIQHQYQEIAQSLEQFAEQARFTRPQDLAARWSTLERQLLACLRADEFEHLLPNGNVWLVSEVEHLRNFAWEVGVSLDINAMHWTALRTLTTLLRRRAARTTADLDASRSSGALPLVGIG